MRAFLAVSFLLLPLMNKGSLVNSLKALPACFRSSLRSHRNNTRFAQPASNSLLVNAIETRVLPVPVACTISALRCLSLKRSQTRVIVSI